MVIGHHPDIIVDYRIQFLRVGCWHADMRRLRLLARVYFRLETSSNTWNKNCAAARKDDDLLMAYFRFCFVHIPTLASPREIQLIIDGRRNHNPSTFSSHKRWRLHLIRKTCQRRKPIGKWHFNRYFSNILYQTIADKIDMTRPQFNWSAPFPNLLLVFMKDRFQRIVRGSRR